MRGRRHWLRVALALTVAGLLVGGAALAWMGFDVTKLNTVHYVTTTHEVDGSFRDIAVLADDGQVALLPSQDGACRVVCREEEEAPYRVAVENGALTVERTARDVFSIFRVSLMQAGSRSEAQASKLQSSSMAATFLSASARISALFGGMVAS